MKSYIKLTILLAFVVMITSCSEESKNRGRDRSVGGTAEILVVTPTNQQWEGIIGDSLRSFFQRDQYGLPQPEAHNVLAHLNTDAFSDMFRKHKSIIEVEIDRSLDKAVATTAEDVWAAPQRYVKITAPDAYAWVELFEQQKDIYQQWFDKVERDRVLTVLRPSKDEALGEAIAKKFGFTLTVPKGFYIAKIEPDFMWLRKELEVSSSDIVIYQTDYQDTLQFETKSLLAMRDLMMSQYIPGPTEGSYMGTEVNIEPPMVTTVPYYPAGYTKEMRGMWKMHNVFMGGPFVSYTFADTRRGKLVTVEGFYYEPNQLKRNAMLQLESIAYSLKFVED